MKVKAKTKKKNVNSKKKLRHLLLQHFFLFEWISHLPIESPLRLTMANACKVKSGKTDKIEMVKMYAIIMQHVNIVIILLKSTIKPIHTYLIALL